MSLYDAYYTHSTCDTDAGYCDCSDLIGYNSLTCLPEVAGCTMCYGDSSGSGNEPGYIVDESSVYSCITTSNYEDLDYEIRVLGAYEADEANSYKIGDQWVNNPGPIYVNLQTCDSEFEKPTILVLASYEPTEWIIDSTDNDVIENINLEKIQVWAYYTDNTTVTLGSGLSAQNPEISISRDSKGYGSDSGGGDTVGMLENIITTFGTEAYSFIGQYNYETVYLCVGIAPYTNHPTAVTSSPSTSPSSSPTLPSFSPSVDPTIEPTSNTNSPSSSPTPSPISYVETSEASNDGVGIATFVWMLIGVWVCNI